MKKLTIEDVKEAITELMVITGNQNQLLGLSYLNKAREIEEGFPDPYFLGNGVWGMNEDGKKESIKAFFLGQKDINKVICKIKNSFPSSHSKQINVDPVGQNCFPTGHQINKVKISFKK